MRVFTDDEKQKLQAKIKDEQERQRVLKEIAQIENEKESKRNSGYDQYGSLIIVLILLFNHIAYQFTKKSWLSRVMKTIAWIWIAFVWAYLFKTGVV